MNLLHTGDLLETEAERKWYTPLTYLSSVLR